MPDDLSPACLPTREQIQAITDEDVVCDWLSAIAEVEENLRDRLEELVS